MDANTLKRKLKKAMKISHFDKIEWIENGKLRITKLCPLCKHDSTTECNRTEFFKWVDGELIQNALHSLTPGQREQLISGVHENCFAQAFPTEKR